MFRDSNFKDKTVSRPSYLIMGLPIPMRRRLLAETLTVPVFDNMSLNLHTVNSKHPELHPTDIRRLINATEWPTIMWAGSLVIEHVCHCEATIDCSKHDSQHDRDLVNTMSAS